MKEAIILAGGFGTRLQHIVSDVPKPMAPINGEPFLSWLLQRLKHAGFTRVILSTGYLHEKIEEFYGTEYQGVQLVYSQEQEPLGTGGAIVFSLQKAQTNEVLVLNGDTLFDIDFDAFYSFHKAHHTNLSVALRQVDDVSRYGAVQTDDKERISAFTEKNQTNGPGTINGGIYLIQKDWLLNKNMPVRFSFEKELLEAEFSNEAFYGISFNAYFIDIGVPEDYARAQTEFKEL